MWMIALLSSHFRYLRPLSSSGVILFCFGSCGVECIYVACMSIACGDSFALSLDLGFFCLFVNAQICSSSMLLILDLFWGCFGMCGWFLAFLDQARWSVCLSGVVLTSDRLSCLGLAGWIIVLQACCVWCCLQFTCRWDSQFQNSAWLVLCRGQVFACQYCPLRTCLFDFCSKLLFSGLYAPARSSPRLITG